MKKRPTLISLLFVILVIQFPLAQVITPPTILEVNEDDRAATIFWNSKTNVYDYRYDPDKQNGIYSYKIEWGPVSAGYIHTQITPYRAHMLQPLEPGVMYQARVFSLDTLGNQSIASAPIMFQHDDTKVNDMRTRLNGFFDDFNSPMGPFEERDWNQSYSGCMAIGKVSQHVNNQFHGHNVIASNHCDRGAAFSRVRHPFDFTNRTGVIEFDLDGSQRTRQFWYLDVSPFSRKRDVTAQTSIGEGHNPGVSDPPFMLRIAEVVDVIEVQLADENGRLFTLPNLYENGACGNFLEYCNGQNLLPLINVRKHWRIELSKTHIRIFINGIKVIDASLITDYAPNGLTFEVAQLNWVAFSYNTPKDNFVLSMIHWDNFGFDAPQGYTQETVIHNYTDGELGSETDQTGNAFSIGKVAEIDLPAISQIPIPDNLVDENGNLPIKAELMFSIQGKDYVWDDNEYILVNDVVYNHSEPETDIIGPIQPYSAIIDLNPNDLIQGINEIKFYMNLPRLLNIHIELQYPIHAAPEYTPPHQIYADHISKLMGFWQAANTTGPGIVFNAINDTEFWTLGSEYNPTPLIDRWYIFNEPASDELSLSILANSEAQLAATGKAAGISHYEIWIDQQVVLTKYVNTDHEIAGFKHDIVLDLTPFSNGLHELFVQAVDVNGNLSSFDGFDANAAPGQYMPTIIDVQNTSTPIHLLADDSGITLYSNHSNNEFIIKGNLSQYEIQILDIQGLVHQDISTTLQEVSISMNNLPTGLYFLKVVNANNANISFQKIIKQ